MTAAEQLRRLRQTRSLTQLELARLLGVSVVSVNRWENGQARPSATTWRRFIALAAEPETVNGAAPPRQTVAAAPAAERAPLIGRDAEMAALQAHLDVALAGRSRVVLLAGEPGIGKTRTAEELASVAERAGAEALWGRCWEGQGAPAFWPWLQIVRELVQRIGAEPLARALEPEAAAVAQLLPPLRVALPELPQLPAVEPEQARFRLFDAVAALIGRAARLRPLLLLLDDLHWADTASLLLLQFLVQQLRTAPLLVVATYRDTDVRREQPLAATLGALARSESVGRLTLHGFDDAETALLIERVAAAQSARGVAAEVRRITDGNPFFIGEVARQLAANGVLGTTEVAAMGRSAVPPSVREVIDARLGTLSSGCRRMLTIAAVLGREFDRRAMAEVACAASASLQELDMTAALAEAETARILDALPGSPDAYGFVHALVRETLYEALPAAVRAGLHEQVGEALERLYAGALEPHLDEVAYHFGESGGHSLARSVRYARAAGDHALAILAHESAALHYEAALRALALLPAPDERQRCELLLGQAEALRRAGEGPACRELFQRAAASAKVLAARVGAAVAAPLLAQAALGFADVWGGEIGLVDRPVVDLLADALAALGEEESGLHAMVLSRYASRLSFAGSGENLPALNRRAIEMARRVDDRAALVRCLDERYWTGFTGEDVDERLANAEEMVRLARAIPSPMLERMGRDLRLVPLLERGEIIAFDEELSACERIAAELQEGRALWRTRLVQAMRAMLSGRFAEAERLSAEAFAAVSRMQIPDAATGFGAQISTIREEQGRSAEFEAPLQGLVAQYPAVAVWRCALAAVYVAAGRFEEARREFEAVAAHDFADIPRDINWLPTLKALAQLCAALDDHRRAARLYELFLPYAGRVIVVVGAVLCYGAADRYLGLLAGTLGRWADAEAYFVRAIELNARITAQPYVAHTRYELARMLLVRQAPGDRERAAALLEQAGGTAKALGMARLAAQVQAAAAGRRAETPAGSGHGPGALLRAARQYPDGLSQREVEVLALLAAGKSNKEIGQALTLSVRTVERHVANIYPKIGAHNRTEAAAHALRNGLLKP